MSAAIKDGPKARRQWSAEQLLAWGSERDERTGCLLWNRSKVRGGYGRATRDGREVYTHRLAWEAANGGPVPAGMQVCHRCDVRHCVEPSHLFLGTQADNYNDMLAKRRHSFGERHACAKISSEDVLQIRSSSDTITVIGARFGISPTYAAEIRRGEKRRLA